jgi:S1-C subfamily serine protease
VSAQPPKIKIEKEELAEPTTLRIALPSVHRGSSIPGLAPDHRRVAWIVFAVCLMMLIGLPLLWTWTPSQWTERVAADADRSVVRIEARGAVGTGFVIGSRGREHLVLTNRHVVGNASEVRVVLRSGVAVKGAVVGLPNHEEVDLAILRISAPGLRPLGPLADFSSVRPGMDVAAVGHPLGLDYTITSGIVSAKRDGLFVQTSAAISPGNSGGPLVRRDGAIVGVNTLVVVPEYGQSLGFAIRADYALDRDRWHFAAGVTQLLDQVQH